ncbi:MAG: transporter substrate-binding domain-containing protein [Nitrospinae bacterium]|nr:transporter substrate-binding domain-containing protein [Nitrospinota bacterium]
MKMLLAALALATLVFTGAVQAADWKEGSTVRIATEGAYPPWNDTDASGKLVGFEIDLAADLCRRMKVTCVMIPRAWEGIIPALRAGAFDAIMSGMAITEERKKRITYSRPFAASPHVFVVRADGPLAGVSTKAASVTLGSLDAKEKAAIGTLRKAFAGKTVGAQAGTVFVNFLKIHMADAVRLRTFKYQGDVDAALLAGRVDALLAQSSYLKPVLERERGKLKVVGPGFTGGSLGEGIGIGIRKEDRALAEMFSRAITAAIKDGALRKLAVKWFGFDLSPKE